MSPEYQYNFAQRFLEVKKFVGRHTFKVQALLFELRYILIGKFLNLQDSFSLLAHLG